MASVSTELKRLFVRDLKWTADDKGLTLFEVLKAVARARLSEIKTGRSITATAGNGHSVTFEIASNGSITPQATAELCSEMLDRYEVAKAALIAGGQAEPSDDAILAEILAGIPEPITEVYSDFSKVTR